MTNIRTGVFAVSAAIAAAVSASAATAQNMMSVDITEAGETNMSRQIVIGLDKSIVVDLDSPASDIVITNPTIADAAVQTAKQMIFRGVGVGQTNAFVFDRNGNQMLNLEIRVEPDTTALMDLISKYVPNARVTAEAVNSNVILSGFVGSLAESDQIVQLASAYLGIEDDPDDPFAGVINMVEIGASDQVMLQVRIVEMQRSVIKQLGINLDGSTSFGQFEGERIEEIVGGPLDGERVLVPAAPFANTVGLNSSNAFNVAGGALGGLGATGVLTNLV
ncbi:MAG: pilus assembly protein N-terminal domain-containing protein, partial [Pseudomonadota bacterium]